MANNASRWHFSGTLCKCATEPWHEHQRELYSKWENYSLIKGVIIMLGCRLDVLVSVWQSDCHQNLVSEKIWCPALQKIYMAPDEGGQPLLSRWGLLQFHPAVDDGREGWRCGLTVHCQAVQGRGRCKVSSTTENNFSLYTWYVGVMWNTWVKSS